MILTSPAFLDEQYLPDIFSYKGANFSPPLKVEEAPSDTKSLCLIVHDPDAPVGDFLHWLVWNISPSQTFIDQNVPPLGAVQAKNDFGNNRWDGPAPPSGTHRYIFELYALDKQLALGGDATRQQLEIDIEGHIIESAKLTGLFSK